MMHMNGSFPDTLLLILLSNAQNKHASKTPTAPTDSPNIPLGSYDKIRHESVIHAIATQIRLPTASLNMNAATRPVATDSKFNKREPIAAGVIAIEYMSVTGASTPPKNDIPAR